MAPMTRNLSLMEYQKITLQPTMLAGLRRSRINHYRGVEVSHPAASGYPNCPNLESDEAKKMWKKSYMKFIKIIHLSSVNYGM